MSAKVVLERPKTTFADIAGYEGAKQEVTHVVDFLCGPLIAGDVREGRLGALLVVELRLRPGQAAQAEDAPAPELALGPPPHVSEHTEEQQKGEQVHEDAADERGRLPLASDLDVVLLEERGEGGVLQGYR